MSKLIGLSIGCFWKWNESLNRNELVSIAKEFDINATELNLFRFPETVNLKLSKENIAWLKSLDYVSIHSPNFYEYNTEKEIKHYLDLVDKIYKQVNASNIVFHPLKMPKPKYLEDYDFNYCIENLHDKFKNSVELKKYNNDYNAPICLDVCHSYVAGKGTTIDLINGFKNNIGEVHISGALYGKHHVPLCKASKSFLNEIKAIKKVNAPFIIESEFLEKNKKIVKEELNFVKEFLN